MTRLEGYHVKEKGSHVRMTRLHCYHVNGKGSHVSMTRLEGYHINVKGLEYHHLNVRRVERQPSSASTKFIYVIEGST